MAGMRTTLGRVRGLGSAKEGTDHFWRQRLTAVANVPLTLFFVGLLIALNGASYDQVRGALGNPLVALLTGAMLVSALIHMRLGMQAILEDYVHGEAARIVLLMLSTFFSIAVGVVSLFALFTIAVGG